MVDVCETYVSDSSARGRDWFAELPGLELFLRSQVRRWIVFVHVQCLVQHLVTTIRDARD